MIEQLKRERFMYPHFIDGILTGQFKKLPLEYMRNVVHERYFGFAPLTELSSEENAFLENSLVKNLDYTLNGRNLELLCRPVFISKKENSLYIDLYTKDAVPYNNYDSFRILLPKEKIDMFFNPDQWLKIRLNELNRSSDMTRFGNRTLINKDGFGYLKSADEFMNLLKRIRRQSDIEHLAVLDIGCGMGLALWDMKVLYHNLETHGITAEQEPAMFKVDHFHYLAAERMPLEFRGKFHLIVSNMSFRYFLFPHIALLNTVKSLAKGGYARISFSYDRIPEEPRELREYFLKQVPDANSNYDAMKVLVKKAVSELKIAQEEGKIRFTTSDSFYDYSMQGMVCIEKISCDD